MTTPEVSVIIPAYNAERTLRQTLLSALAQTYTNFEILVVDDGSSDGTATIAKEMGAPVVCLRQENSGVAAARNRGLDQAVGRYVAFLDADDCWEPEKLERQVELMTDRPEIGACFTAIKRIDGNDRIVGYTPARDYPDFCEALLLESMVVTCASSSAMVRRELAAQLGRFDPRFSQCADFDYCLRLSLHTRLAPIDDPLVLYRTAEGNMSSDIALLERDTFAVLDKFFGTDEATPYLRLRRRCYSNHWMILSGSYLHAGQPVAAIRCLLNGLRLYPRNAVRPLGLPVRWSARAARRLLGPGAGLPIN